MWRTAVGISNLIDTVFNLTDSGAIIKCTF